mmetsp:Transcript_9645/g.19700  ORF Transcript_9645/g.19700 Transcript_9645/m.19700 type:complete len:93 (-) Transcript_9645:275-553(-)
MSFQCNFSLITSPSNVGTMWTNRDILPRVSQSNEVIQFVDRRLLIERNSHLAGPITRMPCTLLILYDFEVTVFSRIGKGVYLEHRHFSLAQY